MYSENKEIDMNIKQLVFMSTLSAVAAFPMYVQAASSPQMMNSQTQNTSSVNSMSNSTRSLPAIKQIQDLLNRKGYKVGKVDGIWNQKELRKFQKDKGLNATGKLNQKTADKLGLNDNEFAAFEDAMSK